MYVFLQDAVVICTAVPWALCCLLYSGLHVTYPRCGGGRQQAVWVLVGVPSFLLHVPISDRLSRACTESHHSSLLHSVTAGWRCARSAPARATRRPCAPACPSHQRSCGRRPHATRPHPTAPVADQLPWMCLLQLAAAVKREEELLVGACLRRCCEPASPCSLLA